MTPWYVIGIDPGPETSGVVVYDWQERRARESYKALGLEDTRSLITAWHMNARLRGERVAVVCERVQSTGQAGGSLLRTSETVGRIMEMAYVTGVPLLLLYRREVLRSLDVTGRGNRDALVRARCLEMHRDLPESARGAKEPAVGTKTNPGPLYGVASHAWQALGAVLAAGPVEAWGNNPEKEVNDG